MNGILKVINTIIKIILPRTVYNLIINRIKRSKDILLSTPELRVLIKICIFPVKVFGDLLIALLKLPFIWLLPYKFYNDVKFIAKQFYMDIIVLNNIPFTVACKRASLLYELFTKGYEQRKSYGVQNSDKIFYVIRPYYFLEPNELILSNVANLLTQYYYALQKLSYAIEKGYIPVIDWEHYGKLPHSEDFPINGTMNSWEYYWKQPSEYTLEEVYKSKNVILSTQNIGQFGYIPNCAMKPPFNTYAKNIARMCPKYSNYIPFNDDTLNYIDEKYNSLFPEGSRVLGVVIRGSSYGTKKTQFSSHPTQISMGELIREVKKCLDSWDCEYIFFMNEVQELVDIMKENFKDKLIVLPRLRDSLYRPVDGSVLNPMYEDGQRFKTNLDYITEVALLSRCTCLVGSMSSGTRTAIMWNNNKYEHMYIFEKGLW